MKTLVIFALLIFITATFADDVANIWTFPYQVSVRKNAKHICGGAVYSPKYILTAATCINNTKEDTYMVVTGTINSAVGASDPYAQFRTVSKVYLYPDFGLKVPQYNLAVLKLDKALKFDKYTNSVSIATKWERMNNCVVTGWYANGTTVARSSLMQKNGTQFNRNKDDCRNYPQFLDNVMMCWGYGTFQNPCVDDLGGPLVCNNTLYGLGSWRDKNCGIPYKPGMYTNVTHLSKWILQTTKTNKATANEPTIWLGVTFVLISIFYR